MRIIVTVLSRSLNVSSRLQTTSWSEGGAIPAVRFFILYGSIGGIKKGKEEKFFQATQEWLSSSRVWRGFGRHASSNLPFTCFSLNAELTVK
jgi:hypothetical protein